MLELDGLSKLSLAPQIQEEHCAASNVALAHLFGTWKIFPMDSISNADISNIANISSISNISSIKVSPSNPFAAKCQKCEHKGNGCHR